MVVPEPAEAPLTVPEAVAAVHAKLAAAGLEVRAIAVLPPEQIESEEGVAVAAGLGLTVIATLIGVPVQLLSVGVTV